MIYSVYMIKEKSASIDKPLKKKAKKKPSSQNIEKIIPGLEEMLKAGVHFGHRASRWNPKMEPYIFGVRNNVHIIDLEKTVEKLKEALNFLQEIKGKKGVVLFVGAKIAAKEIVQQSAQECKMPYVTERWVGGTFTNFPVIAKRLEYFRDLEKKKQSGELKKYTKKEQHDFDIELEKLNKRFGGIKELIKLPDVLLVIDVHKEKTAIREAKQKKIPIVGLCDTNSDPTGIGYPIPVNDDAISSLKLILGAIVKALK